jgi:hypothetical protein
MLGAQDLRGRDHLVLEDLLLVVEVVQEQVEGGDPLDQARLEPGPFVGRDDPRDQVEREDALRALGVVVDREGDAAPQERQVDRRPPALELGQRERAQALGQAR